MALVIQRGAVSQSVSDANEVSNVNVEVAAAAAAAAGCPCYRDYCHTETCSDSAAGGGTQAGPPPEHTSIHRSPGHNTCTQPLLLCYEGL